MPLNPVIHFTGDAEEALQHYRSALGGEVQINRFGEAPPDQATDIDESWKQKVMFGSVVSPLGTVSAMDAPPGRAGNPGTNFSISVQTDSEAQADAAFAKLSEGGNIVMPMGKTFFADKFGMVHDKFGISWLIGYRVQG